MSDGWRSHGMPPELVLKTVAEFDPESQAVAVAVVDIVSRLVVPPTEWSVVLHWIDEDGQMHESTDESEIRGVTRFCPAPGQASHYVAVVDVGGPARLTTISERGDR